MLEEFQENAQAMTDTIGGLREGVSDLQDMMADLNEKIETLLDED